MKRYLTYVTAFLAIIALLLIGGEAVVRSYPNSYRYKAQWMDSSAAQVKTLVLGGSHTYYGIIPGELADSTFSLANVTQHPEYDCWLLEHYIDSCTNLKTVILPVDETNMFESPMADGPEWYRCAYYNIYMGCDLNGSNPAYNFEIANLPSFNRKFKAAVAGWFTGEMAIDCDSLGFGNGFTADKSLDDQEMLRDAMNKAKRHQGVDSVNVAHNESYLNKMAAMCRERGVRLVMVTLPLHKDYVERIDPQRLATLHAIVDQCSKLYGTVYLDHTADLHFQGNDFYDCDHLSQQGARKFTAILKQETGL